ncbi:hypothetical protein [Bifidobacterium longum]|uniref:hypothetical protein n=3 Tax=Bifidobacterium longum TaxID=216816 RepID=UPI0021752B0C|nr:hypothetical protein [Bifidobacterium longum]
MTLRNGFPAVSDAADQFDIRAALRATTAQDANGNIKTGVSITAKSLTGLVTAGNGMNSDIAAFDAVTNRYGPVWLSNDGTISVKHAAAPSANSRIDLICIKQNETASPASDPTDGPEAIIVTGTPAVDPVTPATPEGALALARVTIPSTATSMTSTGVIYEQMYPFTASAGADLLFRSETEKDAWTPWEGQKCRLLDGNEYQAKSGVWVSLTRMPYILCGGHTITTNNDGTFYINVQSPNGKKADYAAYTIGPFGTGFGQAGEYTAQRWDTSDVNQIRFRLWNTKDNRWCGRVAIFGSWIAIWNRQ